MSYYTYILTNSTKTTLYLGVTNSLEVRVLEHGLNSGHTKTFAGKYRCYFLLWYEDYQYVEDAISREKQIKRWNRKKKIKLIERLNPELKFLNEELGLYPFGDYAIRSNIEASKRRSNNQRQ